MILSGLEIRKNLGKGIVITPFDESRLNPNSYNLRLADVLTAFYRHSLQAYQEGVLKIRREPVVMQMQVKGWSE